MAANVGAEASTRAIEVMFRTYLPRVGLRDGGFDEAARLVGGRRLVGRRRLLGVRSRQRSRLLAGLVMLLVVRVRVGMWVGVRVVVVRRGVGVGVGVRVRGVRVLVSGRVFVAAVQPGLALGAALLARVAHHRHEPFGQLLGLGLGQVLLVAVGAQVEDCARVRGGGRTPPRGPALRCTGDGHRDRCSLPRDGRHLD